MVNPDKFFDTWEDAKSSRANITEQNYQKRILKKYFSTMVENAVIDSIWYDKSVVNKLEELKFKVADPTFSAIDIKKYPTMYLLDMYRNISKFPIWKDLMGMIAEHNEAGIVFQLYKDGNYILHNFPRQPDEVLKKPKIIWPGNAGSDLTLEKLDVFLEVYKIGD